ncbi:MAG: hypothetical protein AB7U73_02300 [Pirellulales bacterium]
MKPLRLLWGFSRRVQQTQGVSLAVLLGLLAGFVGGWNLSLVALLLLAVVFNVRARTFFVMWAGGFALSWVLVPLSFGLGRWLLDRTKLGEWLAANFDEQLIAWLGWDRYTLVGGTLLAVFLAVPMLVGLRAWRRRKLRPARAIDDAAPATTASATATDAGTVPIAPTRLPRWRRWLGSAEQALVADAAVPRGGLVRPWALWGLVASLATAALAAWLLTPRIAATRLLEVLTWGNGAEVTAEHVRVTPWTGNVEIDGLSVADPLSPDRDRLRVGHLRGQLDVAALIRGRLEVESLSLAGISTSVAREHAAGIVRTSGPDDQSLADAETAAFVDAATAPPSAELALGQCVDCWGLAEDNVARLEELVHRMAVVAAIDTDERYQTLSLAEQRAARSPLGKKQPRVHVRELLAEGLPLDWQLGSDVQLRITDLASGGVSAARPARVVVRVPHHALDLRVTLAAHDAQAEGHLLEFHLFDVPATSLLAPPSGHQRLVCESGMVTLGGRGQFTRRSLALAGTLRADRLKAHVIGGEPLGGLDPEVWNQALRSIGRLQTTFAVRGSLSRPELVLDPLQVAQHVEAELRSVGQHRLAAHVEQCLSGRPPLGSAIANQSGDLVENEWLADSTPSAAGFATDQTAAANAGAALDGAACAPCDPALADAPAWSQPCAVPAESAWGSATPPNSSVAMPLPEEVAAAVTSDQPPLVEYEADAPVYQPSMPAPVGGPAPTAAVAMPQSPYVSVKFSPNSPQGPGAIDLVTGHDPADRAAPIAYRQTVEPREPADWPLDRPATAPGAPLAATTTPPMEALPGATTNGPPASAPVDLAALAHPAAGSHQYHPSTASARVESLADDGKSEGWTKKFSKWSRTTLAQARDMAWPFGKEKLPEEPEFNGDEWPRDSSWRVGSKIDAPDSDRTAANSGSSSRDGESRNKRRLR